MASKYSEWRRWFKEFLIWEWGTHILVLLIVLMVTATRFDHTEIWALALMAASTAVTGVIGYWQMTRCMAHPRRFFRRIRWWMKRLILFEYFGYTAELALILWLTASRFDHTELYTLALAGAANGLMSWRGWRSFVAMDASDRSLCRGAEIRKEVK